MKSPPELWTELSEVDSLARHLGELGEIRITKVEPETTVAWEGEQISGTVALEQSGWGTKVTLTATVPEPEAVPEPEPVAEPDQEAATAVPEPGATADPEPEAAPEPEAVAEPDQATTAVAEPDAAPEPEPARGSFWARLLGRRKRPEPALVPDEAAPEPAPVAAEPDEPELAGVEAVEAHPAQDSVPDPAPAVNAAPEPAAAREAPDALVQRVFDSALDALGQAHHRPFSRG